MWLPWQQRSAPLVVSPGMPKHIGSIWHTRRLIGDFVKKAQICQNFVAMATRVGPTTFCMVPLNRRSPKTPSRPKHFLPICHTSRLIGDFEQVQIWGGKFWGLWGLNQKSKKRFLECHTENRRPKMARFHRVTRKKKQFEGAPWQTYSQTYIQTDRVNDKK